MPSTAVTIPATDGLAADLAAAVRALNETPGAVTPAVVVAAYILAAEQLTAQAEACQVCASGPGLCGHCSVVSSRAVGYRMHAGQLRQLAGSL